MVPPEAVAPGFSKPPGQRRKAGETVFDPNRWNGLAWISARCFLRLAGQIGFGAHVTHSSRRLASLRVASRSSGRIRAGLARSAGVRDQKPDTLPPPVPDARERQNGRKRFQAVSRGTPTLTVPGQGFESGVVGRNDLAEATDLKDLSYRSRERADHQFSALSLERLGQ